MKKIKLLYLPFLLSGAITACNSGNSSTSTASAPYTINVPMTNSKVNLNPSLFSLTTTGTLATAYPSNVTVSFDASQEALIVGFNNTNDLQVNQNNYTQDNSAMWNQEVFEMFISPGSNTPTEYVEIEVNPNNALFSAQITNPNGKGTENTATLFDGRTDGIQTSVNKSSTSWEGTITFPLTILGPLTNSYRVNFFRIVSLTAESSTTSWACTSTSCEYLAWSPTFSGASPAFHIPQYFGQLNLIP